MRLLRTSCLGALVALNLLGCTDLPPVEPSSGVQYAKGGNSGGGGGGDGSGGGNTQAKQDCTQTYQLDANGNGLIEIADLGSGFFQPHTGEAPVQGGLYPGGSNERPASHEAVMPTITPVRGKIGVVSFGSSIANILNKAWIATYDADLERSVEVVLINAGQGHMRADDWANPNCNCWSAVDKAITSAGLQKNQVLVAVYKNQEEVVPHGFESGVEQNRVWLDQAITNFRNRYPTVKSFYLMNGIYKGYAGFEPGAYTNGWSVKQVVEGRLGRTDPWVAWGPRLWSNGLGADHALGGDPGRADGLEWQCSDFGGDGLHPSEQGAIKAAGVYQAFFKNDPSSRDWFVKR